MQNYTTNKIIEALHGFENYLLEKKVYKNSNPELNIEVFTSRILMHKTLEDTGAKYKVSKERVRQIETNIFSDLKSCFIKLNAEINKKLSDIKFVIKIDENNSKELTSYFNIIEKYYLKEKNSNRSFNIDLKNSLMYSRILDKDKVFYSIKENLKDSNVYDKNEILSLIYNEIFDIFDKSQDCLEYAQLLYPAFVDDKEHFIRIFEDKEQYLFSKEKLNKTAIRRKKFLCLFKLLYPNGIHIPQYNPKFLNNAEEIGKENLQVLFKNYPEMTKNSYRSVYNFIVSLDEVISYDTGHFIHKDYIEELCVLNNIFLSKLSDLMHQLINDKYDCLNTRTVFISIEDEFKQSGIATYELLFYLLKLSKINAFDYKVINKRLLLLRKGLLGNNFCIRYDDSIKKIDSKECKPIKDFLKSNTFNSTLTLNTENKLQKINHTMDEVDDEYDSLNNTEKEAVVKARLGQAKLRTELLKRQQKCELCAIDLKDVLVASHIKPWSESNDNERMDIDNVLLLCSMHDSLFDKGYISFKKNGKIIISPRINPNMYSLYNIHNTDKIENVSDKKADYLSYHFNRNKDKLK